MQHWHQPFHLWWTTLSVYTQISVSISISTVTTRCKNVKRKQNTDQSTKTHTHIQGGRESARECIVTQITKNFLWLAIFFCIQNQCVWVHMWACLKRNHLKFCPHKSSIYRVQAAPKLTQRNKKIKIAYTFLFPRFFSFFIYVETKLIGHHRRIKCEQNITCALCVLYFHLVLCLFLSLCVCVYISSPLLTHKTASQLNWMHSNAFSASIIICYEAPWFSHSISNIWTAENFSKNAKKIIKRHKEQKKHFNCFLLQQQQQQ